MTADLPSAFARAMTWFVVGLCAVLLAVIPSFIFRWIVERVARWRLTRGSNGTLA